jgi:hypothetical protein
VRPLHAQPHHPLATAERFHPADGNESGNYCEEVERELNVFVETTLLTGNFVSQWASAHRNASSAPSFEHGYRCHCLLLTVLLGKAQGSSPVAQAFEALARSYAPFSRMVLIAGEGFVLFVDIKIPRWTRRRLRPCAMWKRFAFTPSCSSAWCQ